MSVEVKLEKRKCPACKADKKFKVKVVYKGDVEIRADLCPICETDANVIRSSIFSRIRQVADSIDTVGKLLRLGKHFLGYLSDSNKEDLKAKKVTTTVVKNIVAGKTDLSKVLKKHDPEIRIIIMRKVLNSIAQDGDKLMYLPVERFEPASEPMANFLDFVGDPGKIVKEKRDIHRGLKFLNTHFVFEELRKADQAGDIQRIKTLYVEAFSRDLEKTQERFVNLFKKFNDSQCVRKAVYWEQLNESYIKEKSVDDLIRHFSG